MSNEYLNPTTLLHKTIVVEFEGELETMLVTDVNDECIQTMVGDCEAPFYAELYLEDLNRFWCIREVL